MAFRPYRPKGLPQLEGGAEPHLDGELRKIADSLETTRESLDALDTLLAFPTDTLFGRDASGDGEPEYLTVGGGIEFTGSGGLRTSAFTGDVVKAAGGTALAIPDDTVTYAKMQNVSATDRLLGRSTAGAGNVEEIACTAAGRALIDDATAGDQRTTLSAAARSQIGQMTIGVKTPQAQEYYFTISAPYGMTLTNIATYNVSGTCNVTLKINNVAVTGGTVNANNTVQNFSLTAANVVSATNPVHITVSAIGGSTNLWVAVTFTRTLA